MGDYSKLSTVGLNYHYINMLKYRMTMGTMVCVCGGCRIMIIMIIVDYYSDLIVYLFAVLRCRLYMYTLLWPCCQSTDPKITVGPRACNQR